MKIAFFGTPPFTTDFLECLKKNEYIPSLVVTAPDTRSGRGMTLQSPAPKVWADAHGIPVVQPEKLNDNFINKLSVEAWDLFVVVAYGKIMPEKLITFPRFGTINVHYSLLPRYRGASPVESAILSGDEKTGVTIQHMRYQLDSGPILSERIVSIDPSDTTQTLRTKLNQEALDTLPALIEDIFAGRIEPKEQDDSQATFTKKIKKEAGEISLTEDSVVLDRKFRAYTPWPGIYFFIRKDNKRVRVKITKAHLTDGVFIIDEVVLENGKPIPYQSFNLLQT